MLTTILTKSGGILGPIANLLGFIMNGIYEFFTMFGIHNIGLSIIVFTFITRAFMLPLTIRQQKFSKLSSKMQPELSKINEKYKGKKDEASLRKRQAETTAIYQKYGANPTSGCLPMLITLPIMFALFQVINRIAAYVTQVRVLYEQIAASLQTQEGYAQVLVDIGEGIRNLHIRNLDKLAENGELSLNHIIDILSKFRTENWETLVENFPGLTELIQANLNNIQNVNSFLGLRITDTPGWAFPGILIPLLAMGFQFIQGKQIEVKNKGNNQDNPAANAMASMNVVMPIMSGVFTVTLPVGVGIYWIASSIFAIIQQFFVNKYMDRIDVDELIEKSAAKAKKRNDKIASYTGSSVQDIAKKQTKSIETNIPEKVNNLEKETNTSYNPKSISEIANLLKNKNYEKGDK